MNLPISRGVVRNSLLDNICDMFSAFFLRNVLKEASDNLSQNLKDKITEMTAYEHVILFPYARSAFYASLKSLSLSKNSKILMTPITIGPMLEVIEVLGHQVIFVDIETKTYGASLNDFKEKISTYDIDVFLYTHLFGYDAPQLEEIAKICKISGIHLIEDISHNLNPTDDRSSPNIHGNIAIYSASLLKYVDSYNGAFAVTNNKEIGIKLSHIEESFSSPNPKRIKAIVFKSLIWNFALGRLFFSFITFPLLYILKYFSPNKFEKILGPGIKYTNNIKLPDLYFEKLSQLQAKAMLRGLTRLPDLIKSRRLIIERAIRALNKYDKNKANFLLANIKKFTFWQFVLPVKSVSSAREALFSIGVETSTTNLRDLAADSGRSLSGSSNLKSKHIFIPAHSYMLTSDFERIFLKLDNQGLSIGSNNEDILEN